MPETLIARNRAWAAERLKVDPDYFKRLSAIQRPRFLWIGCADSRVPANVITGLEPGEVFVHRNVANLVHSGDLNMLSVLEYAVTALNVAHIIVCGHYGCGGVRAAIDGKRHGVIDHWLQPIRDVDHAHEKALSKIKDPERRHEALCELSVKAQVEALANTPIIQTAWADGSRVELHGWVYGLSDGLLRELVSMYPNRA